MISSRNKTYKTCLAINGSPGSQKGLEQTFDPSLNTMIDENKIIYFEDDCIRLGVNPASNKLIETITRFRPQVLIFFHLSNIILPNSLISKLYQISPKMKIIYDEGDMFGGLAKPILPHMKNVMRRVDGVFIRGLGNWYKECSIYNNNIIYVPHINSLPMVDENSYSINRKACFVGNKITSRRGPFFRLPGAYNREKLVKYLDSHISDFEVYGKGWDDLKSNRGFIEFQDQALLYDQNTFHFSYEHYPKIPLYWSDRMPISLYRGQIYITHEHGLYNEYFKEAKGVFMFKTKQEALDIYKFLLSRSNDELKALRKINADVAKNIFDSISIYNNAIKQVL